MNILLIERPKQKGDMRRPRDEVDQLVARVNEKGRLVLDLSDVIQQQVNLLKQAQQRQNNLSGTDEEEEQEERRPFPRNRFGVDGYGRPPSRYFDAERIDDERMQQIVNNPVEYIEFVYQNRRFKLTPIGTIEPVPKIVRESDNGSLYYYKTRDSSGNVLPPHKWTKVYLKRHQIQQCLNGGSTRTAGMGLAGLVPGETVCRLQPEERRRTAARQPRQ